MRKTTQAQRSTFLMSNITPQNPQRIRNQIAIPSSYIKILKGENFKECYQVPNHEVENEHIRSYQVKCQN